MEIFETYEKESQKMPLDLSDGKRTVIEMSDFANSLYNLTSVFCLFVRY